MAKRIICSVSWMVILVLLPIAVQADIDPPHDGSNAISCQDCHFFIIEGGILQITVTRGEEQEALCKNCHNPNGQASGMSNVANHVVNGGNTIIECGSCHDPHGPDIVVDPHTGMEASNLKLIRKKTRYVEGALDLAIFQQRPDHFSFSESNSPWNGICQTCHTQTNHHQNDGDAPGGQSHYSSDRCMDCHLHVNGFAHGTGSSGTGCEDCHGHDDGYEYSPGLFSSGAGTFKSHSTHTENDADDYRGPFIDCSDCHDTDNFPYFISGEDNNGDGNYDLSEADVCDTCHSPGGTYDGIYDTAVGVKYNWTDGIYADASLSEGKEKWCATCHDELPGNSQPDGTGVDAPNVIGDEDGIYRYGTGWGYYKTGHGLASGTYPATGAPAANTECLDCHDSTIAHVDHIARTYVPDSDYLTYDPVSSNYQNGFRLKDVSTGYDGKYPMYMPRTFSNDPPPEKIEKVALLWEFALCFECHDWNKLFDGGDPVTGIGAGTNFYELSDGDGGGLPAPVIGEYVSLHYVHTWGINGPLSAETPQYDSDFDGIADSRMSCPSCHNVHGSRSPVMFRYGELAVTTSPVTNIVPFFDFQYTGLTCGSDNFPTLFESTGGAGTRFYASGPGDVSRNGVCNMCHNEYLGQYGDGNTGYTRIPVDVITPKILWVDGQSGSNILIVRFSEGVYTNIGASGSLVSGDISLTSSASISFVTHSPGDAVAWLTLDSSPDIGIDNLSAFDASSIFDASDNAVDTTSVTILEDNGPPTIAHQTPADGTIGIAINSVLTFTLYDSGSGIDWSTFSIQLSGDKGYSESYTDADTSIVSGIGDPGGYVIYVDPDTDFGAGEVITVTVNVDDLHGNSSVTPAWSFTTGSQGKIVLHPSGVDDSGPFDVKPPGDFWANVLDCNDRDMTYVSKCCGWSEAPGENHVFTVDMDDPGAELQGRTIEGITIGVYARYGVEDEADGSIDIGYSMWSAVGWKGAVPMSQSSEYSLITMTDTFTAGTVFSPDIQGLTVSVRRVDAIASSLNVTEVYAEVAFGETDTTVPVASSLNPANGLTDISVGSNLSLTIADNESGIDWSTFEIQITGTGYSETYTDLDTSNVSKTGTTPASYDVIVNPDVDFPAGEVMTVTVNVDNYASLSLTPPTWSFTTLAPNNAPALDWTGETNYTADGVNPDTDVHGSSFVFRVEYTDADNEAPGSIEIWVDQDDSGTYISGEKYTMSVDGGDSDYTNGEIYTRTLTLSNAGDNDLSYIFYASDGEDDATGTPATTGGTVTVTPAAGNNAPALAWTGETNYLSDGVNPDSGASGSSFEFRVDYTDADNEAPTSIQVWIDEDDNSSYVGGEQYAMTAVTPGDTDYTDGKLYTASRTLTYAGDGVLNYRFYASDGTDTATGSPITSSTVTVTSADSVPPVITGRDPYDNEYDVWPDSNISFTVSDALSGVDLDTLKITIYESDWNRTTVYNYGDPTVTVSGDLDPGPGESFDVIVNPSTDFNEWEYVTVTVDVDDNSSNSLQDSWEFVIWYDWYPST